MIYIPLGLLALIILCITYFSLKPKFKIGDKIIFSLTKKEFGDNYVEYEILKVGNNYYLLLNLKDNNKRFTTQEYLRELPISTIDALYERC